VKSVKYCMDCNQISVRNSCEIAKLMKNFSLEIAWRLEREHFISLCEAMRAGAWSSNTIKDTRIIIA
jgi:hypothetical protein